MDYRGQMGQRPEVEMVPAAYETPTVEIRFAELREDSLYDAQAYEGQGRPPREGSFVGFSIDSSDS